MAEDTMLTFPAFFNNTLERFGERDALALIGEQPLTYRETHKRIRSVMASLEAAGISPGDKVVLLGTNQPNWAIAYYAVTFMGAVAVPLMPEFQPSEMALLIDHSETKLAFVSEGLLPKVTGLDTPGLQTIVRLENFEIISSTIQVKAYNPQAEPSRSYMVEEDDLASIIYTSGTTGKPKGVMLSHKNICINAVMGFEIQPVNETDRFLSILPLSHTYENTLGLILPMFRGAVVYYLGKLPTPAILLPALKEVKPTTMLTVPLIIEKIFRNKILPAFNDRFMLRMLYKLPPFRKLLHLAAGRKLKETFGGHLRFFGVGGAKLNRTVERFLIEAKFPYAIGYGLTECAPMLAGFNPHQARLQSTGPVCNRVEMQIKELNHRPGEGEIWVKGPNVMKGYYKEPELTAEVITPDGWLKTGDVGTFGKGGYLYIKGRVKTVIIRSSGENIYPEDIESVINNFRHVVESLVVEQKGKLIALVHFNHEEIELSYKHMKTEIAGYVEHVIEQLRAELQAYVNSRVNKFSQVQVVVAQPDPFQKTATQKIKRYLYV